MRPTFPSVLLVAASLACPPTAGLAQNAEDKQAAGNASSTSKVQEPAKPLSNEEQAEARRLAREERAREAERERLERERQCRIKPVMTDAEITLCKEVWR
ncbi:MAG: hypothetical protein EFKGCFLK_02618 [Rhodocyclaceae bacterium]|nr:MAG: hypothetical protein F9K21_04585 [Rhodocyclaceae bacterium]MBV6408997.1 hypothetical protein [Rhodocyclaceae bacterium]CAG0931694.1 hypothetical protein RHDC3_01957 [Rhodocyclaceae bacterium]